MERGELGRHAVGALSERGIYAKQSSSGAFNMVRKYSSAFLSLFEAAYLDLAWLSGHAYP